MNAYYGLAMLAMASLFVTQAQAAIPAVTNVVAVQDGSNKIVNISYDVSDDDGASKEHFPRSDHVRGP